MVNDQVRLGLLSAREAAEAATRHMLSRSLGNDLFVNVEISEHQVMPATCCCSAPTACTAPSTAPEMAAVVSRQRTIWTTPRAKLVALANERDGSDNVSVQLIRVRSVERVGMYRGRPYKLR